MEEVRKEHVLRGHIFINNAFHDHMDERVQNILTAITDDINAYYERGKPDAFVITKDNGCYQVDCKTLDSWRRPANGNTIPNASIEASSYAFDYDTARLGVKTLVPYHDPFYNVEKGFWLEKLSRYRPNVVMVPPQTVGTEKEKEIVQLCKMIFGSDIRIQRLTYEQCKSDSGDPFILIPANIVLNMKHWKNLIP